MEVLRRLRTPSDWNLGSGLQGWAAARPFREADDELCREGIGGLGLALVDASHREGFFFLKPGERLRQGKEPN